jgi:hypothetical protein
MISTLTPAAFERKWAESTRTERAGAQEHLIDLCRLLGVPAARGRVDLGEDPCNSPYAPTATGHTNPRRELHIN